MVDSRPSMPPSAMEAHPCTTAVDLRYRIDDGEVRVRASYPETRGGNLNPTTDPSTAEVGRKMGSQALDHASDGWGWFW